MGDLTHLDADGAARMVDVSAKDVTLRRAVARGRVRMQPDTLARISAGAMPKGDVYQVARIAGIMAAKRTGDLLPLCHPLGLESVRVDFRPDGDAAVANEAEVAVEARTGVEMEALTAVSVAALTLYDMCKAVDKTMVIEGVHLAEKTGGRSGTFTHPDPPAFPG